MIYLSAAHLPYPPATRCSKRPSRGTTLTLLTPHRQKKSKREPPLNIPKDPVFGFSEPRTPQWARTGPNGLQRCCVLFLWPGTWTGKHSEGGEGEWNRGCQQRGAVSPGVRRSLRRRCWNRTRDGASVHAWGSPCSSQVIGAGAEDPWTQPQREACPLSLRVRNTLVVLPTVWLRCHVLPPNFSPWRRQPRPY